jgi:hypothetical protein
MQVAISEEDLREAIEKIMLNLAAGRREKKQIEEEKAKEGGDDK